MKRFHPLFKYFITVFTWGIKESLTRLLASFKAPHLRHRSNAPITITQ
jgi:hypothetical protein